MTLKQLKYLLGIVDSGLNITAAAERLYTSQPGISKQLKQLEAELGMQLFTRKGKSLAAVTPAGREVIDRARKIAREVENITSLARDLTGEQEGTLSIATTHTQARYVLPDVIRKFSERYPKVNLELHQGTSEQIAELVCSHQVDFAIATGAAGQTETRDGSDVLGVLIGDADPREHVIGWYGVPGKADFKVMVRHGESKYIYLANGGREQLFNLVEDPQELRDRSKTDSDVLESLREIAISQCEQPEAEGALENGTLKAFPFTPRERNRIYQFDLSRGVAKFPERPEDALKSQVV